MHIYIYICVCVCVCVCVRARVCVYMRTCVCGKKKKNHTRIWTFCTRFSLSGHAPVCVYIYIYIPATAQRIQEFLQIIAVKICSAENHALVHLDACSACNLHTYIRTYIHTYINVYIHILSVLIPATAQQIEEFLQIIAVKICSAENHALVHPECVDETY